MGGRALGRRLLPLELEVSLPELEDGFNRGPALLACTGALFSTPEHFWRFTLGTCSMYILFRFCQLNFSCIFDINMV